MNARTIKFRKVGEGEYVATDQEDGLEVKVESTWNKALGHHWRCADPETRTLQRGACAETALADLAEPGDNRLTAPGEATKVLPEVSCAEVRYFAC